MYVHNLLNCLIDLRKKKNYKIIIRPIHCKSVVNYKTYVNDFKKLIILKKQCT